MLSAMAARMLASRWHASSTVGLHLSAICMSPLQADCDVASRHSKGFAGPDEREERGRESEMIMGARRESKRNTALGRNQQQRGC